MEGDSGDERERLGKNENENEEEAEEGGPEAERRAEAPGI